MHILYLIYGLNILGCLCYSLFLVYILYIRFWNVRPVCPMYFSGQSIHLIWYTPLLRIYLFAGEALVGFVLCLLFGMLLLFMLL
jgi:hypothetical protein